MNVHILSRQIQGAKLVHTTVVELYTPNMQIKKEYQTKATDIKTSLRERWVHTAVVQLYSYDDTVLQTN